MRFCPFPAGGSHVCEFMLSACASAEGGCGSSMPALARAHTYRAPAALLASAFGKRAKRVVDAKRAAGAKRHTYMLTRAYGQAH